MTIIITERLKDLSVRNVVSCYFGCLLSVVVVWRRLN